MASYQQGEGNITAEIEGNSSEHVPGIIVQGGGYSLTLGHLKQKYEEATKESAKAGYDILMQNGGTGTAADAVEAAVRVLENDPDFNAGRGSLLNTKGKVECDAMIMEGHTLNNGAVISGRHFFHPVSLAKMIMNDSYHCALSGKGARKFAKEKHFPDMCHPEDLVTQRALDVSVDYPDFDTFVKHCYNGAPVMAIHQDTVSAVAIDAQGHLACATSTGGIAGKHEGRVGDAPLVGCGGYANEEGAATATGHGEEIIKMTLSRDVVYMIESGQNAQISAEKAVEKMDKRVRDTGYGYGGVIVIDKEGNFGKAFNTAVMVWASIKRNTLEHGMEKDESESEPYIPQ